MGWLRPEFTSEADRISCLDKMVRNSRVLLRWVKLNQTPSAALDLASDAGAVLHLASDAGAALQVRRNSLQSVPSRALPLRRPPPPLPPREPPPLLAVRRVLKSWPPPRKPLAVLAGAAPLLASPSPCSQLPSSRARRLAHDLPPPREWPLPPPCSRPRPLISRRLRCRPSSGLRLPCSRTAAAAALARGPPARLFAARRRHRAPVAGFGRLERKEGKRAFRERFLREPSMSRVVRPKRATHANRCFVGLFARGWHRL